MQRGSFLAYAVGLSAALMITRRRATEDLKRTKLKSVALEIKGMRAHAHWLLVKNILLWCRLSKP